MKYRLLATAGHVDHGKTELLKALTGQETDRLDEEKDRGLTIDLGFADMKRNDLHLGFVDVPGHHNFIKNMVSGVGSVQGVVFVVSAADGWEEQSREHFEIVRLVQPDYCCFVLTKIDLVDEEMELLARAEVEDAKDGTDFEDADIVPVSSIESTGIDPLKEKLFDDLSETSDPPDDGKPYCPVDRVFTVKGQGTVMTGSLSGGTVGTEEMVIRMPDGENGRVRSIQQYHESSEVAQPGSRVALNVPDWDRPEVGRGDVVTVPEAGSIANRVDGLVETPASLRGEIEHDQQVLAYLGTGRDEVKLLLEDQRSLPSESEAIGRLDFMDSEVFVRPGDRIILRDFSDRRLLGCLTVLQSNPDKSIHEEEYRIWLRSRYPVEPETLLRSELKKNGIVREADLASGTAFSPETFRDVTETQESVRYVRSEWIVDERWLEEETGMLRSKVENYHRDYPLRPGLPLSELNTRYPSETVREVLLEELSDSELTVGDEYLKLSSFTPEPDGDQKEQINDLMNELNEAGLETPDRTELTDSFSEDVLKYLIWDSRLVLLSDERIVTSEVYDDLVETVRSYLEEHQPATLAEMRDLMDSSRKYVIPLMEHLDQEGITFRDGDVRYLRNEKTAADS